MLESKKIPLDEAMAKSVVIAGVDTGCYFWQLSILTAAIACI
jgi:hypothetical protein